MNSVHRRNRVSGVTRALALSVTLAGNVAVASETPVTPAQMPRIGTVDERFQSYNVEMIEVTGGKFWKPYGPEHAPAAQQPRTTAPSASDTPAGMDSRLYAYRPPIDLANTRLRKLAAALAPAYVRVSGTWANTTYFSESGNSPSAPPSGYKGVLTGEQWRGVIDFARAVDARIVTSVAISPGTRDADGMWTPDQARRLLAYTRSIGGSIAAAEFMNEPDLAVMGGAPAGYDATAYRRDFRNFHAFVKRTDPEIMILGPGTVGDSAVVSDLLDASGTGVDVFSYHHYGTLSQRCTGAGNPEAALSEEWLFRTDRTLAFHRALRDRFEPGKPIWLTETAEAACGGNPWAATFLDTFRYVDQLGRLAKAGVQVVMHNTLAASDYGLLDERTLAPRPNYWGALLWRRLMGTTVLESGVPAQAGLHVYAHCQRGVPGGVTMLVINNDRSASHSLTLASASARYTLDAADLLDGSVRLNGSALALSAADDLPEFAGAPAAAGAVTLAPATISFLAMPSAGNSACL